MRQLIWLLMLLGLWLTTGCEKKEPPIGQQIPPVQYELTIREGGGQTTTINAGQGGFRVVPDFTTDTNGALAQCTWSSVLPNQPRLELLLRPDSMATPTQATLPAAFGTGAYPIKPIQIVTTQVADTFYVVTLQAPVAPPIPNIALRWTVNNEVVGNQPQIQVTVGTQSAAQMQVELAFVNQTTTLPEVVVRKTFDLTAGALPGAVVLSIRDSTVDTLTYKRLAFRAPQVSPPVSLTTIRLDNNPDIVDLQNGLEYLLLPWANLQQIPLRFRADAGGAYQTDFEVFRALSGLEAGIFCQAVRAQKIVSRKTGHYRSAIVRYTGTNGHIWDALPADQQAGQHVNVDMWQAVGDAPFGGKAYAGMVVAELTMRNRTTNATQTMRFSGRMAFGWPQ